MWVFTQMHRATAQDPSLQPTRSIGRSINGHIVSIFAILNMGSSLILCFLPLGGGGGGGGEGDETGNHSILQKAGRYSRLETTEVILCRRQLAKVQAIRYCSPFIHIHPSYASWNKSSNNSLLCYADITLATSKINITFFIPA